MCFVYKNVLHLYPYGLMVVPKHRDGEMSLLPLLALPAPGKGNCLSLPLNFHFVPLCLFLLTFALFPLS